MRLGMFGQALLPDLKLPMIATRDVGDYETVKGEIVLLIIQGFVHQNEIKSSSYVVVCAPTGLDELYTDLEVKERQVKAGINKVVRDAIERN